MMNRIFFLGNNWVALQILEWLQEQGEEIVGLAIHPKPKRKFGEEILRAAELSPEAIFCGSRLREPKVLRAIKRLAPDIGISVFFGYILRPQFLDMFPLGVVNLHPAYLPYNRGAYPNVWSIIDETPAGVTLHYIDVGVDTGDIIRQRRVPVFSVDTGYTLYERLSCACLDLFKATWPLLCDRRAGRSLQNEEEATFHYTRDVKQVDCIDLDRTYTGRELINILRARTHPPYAGAYFMDGGRKVLLSLQLYFERIDDRDH